ncbi:isochorismate synthase [Ulvibacter antarcticus]|uniref:isochorismate synthase n=1 Tax=Ulvibacter antarcticus TaxID=442714 RepID=A0A3L9YH69_9FLAO|nr:isochorismate synthase [Ulvibacter antarcticus]RMA58907.1 isochorismate synthase [Ulvibacter antarcticus]
MEIVQLFQKIENHYKDNKPFTIYSLPGSNVISSLFQNTDEIFTTKSFTEAGMIMAPFDTERLTYFIPENASEKIETAFVLEDIQKEEIQIKESLADHARHLKLVSEAKNALRTERIQKIVVSRKKEISLKNVNITAIARRLLSLYPSAFRYMWYHPNTGLWCGASPEVLVKISGLSFSTMALAGTRKIAKNQIPDWTTKDITEQQLVTDAITTNLQKVTAVVKLSKTYTYHAGTLAHLRTDITGVLKNGKATLTTIAAALHPTPAVCGSPKILARKFIMNHEGYERDFYTGFIGPVSPVTCDSQLFVNLRCMKIEGSMAKLYVGGGIISESVPEDEWQETCNKLQTMLQVVHPSL